MKNSHWVFITIVATLIGFVSGYYLSSKTGVEPGFFQAVETGSYGGATDTETVKGVGEKDKEYYKGLTEE
ncbi:MAG: hypothetical protein BMS9Abin11_1140 [Gammaproteobacteria bacterium]|nr:MAG: hypothetical protein BMS9Abin11_1140 [Gammaproteobacteria bacterium]